MDIRVNDILVMKKPHPCGEKRWLVLRTGADFRLRCLGCGHELMTPRFKAEKKYPLRGAEGDLRQLMSEVFRSPPLMPPKGRRSGGNLRRRGDMVATDFSRERGYTFAIPAGGDALKIYLDLVVILNFLVDFCCFLGQTVYRLSGVAPRAGRASGGRWGRV